MYRFENGCLNGLRIEAVYPKAITYTLFIADPDMLAFPNAEAFGKVETERMVNCDRVIGDLTGLDKENRHVTGRV